MSTTTDQFERLVLDGPVSVTLACLIGALLTTGMAWLLHRERNVLGGRTALMFWVLRSASIWILIWLLLAPMRLTVERTTTPKAIAVLTDISGSMKTIDPTFYQQQRWAMDKGGRHVADERRPLVMADRATAAAGISQTKILAAINAVQVQQADDLSLDALSMAAHGIERVRHHLTQIVDKPSKDSSRQGDAVADPHGAVRFEVVRQATEILKMLDGQMFTILADVAKRHRDELPVDPRRWQDQLPDLSHRMDVVHRELAKLTRTAERLPPSIGSDTVRPVSAKDDGTGPNPSSAPTASERDRSRQVQDFLQRWMASLDESHRDSVRHFHFDRELTAIGSNDLVTADGREAQRNALTTDLDRVFGTLGDLHQTQPIAAVVVLSDMSHNAGGRDPVDVAKSLGLPFYLLPIGNTGYVRDVELASISAPNVVLQGDQIVVESTVRAHHCEGMELQLELVEAGAVLETRILPIESEMTSRRVRLETKATDIGVHGYALRVATVDGELTDENNLHEFQVHVTEDSIRVLVGDERARYEHRYLTHLLRRDAQVQHDELVHEPRVLATGSRLASGALPQTVDEWDEYDVVVLGDLPTEMLSVTSQLALVEFLEQRGGTLVLVAGANHMPQAYENQPLESILPVQAVDSTTPSREYHLRMSEEGWRHHALLIGDDRGNTAASWQFVNDNSPVEWVSQYRRPRPSAHSLIQIAPADSSAATTENFLDSFLSWQSVGRGRIVYLSSPESYRLRFLRGDRLHHRFWGQLLRWAVATDLAIGSDRVRIRTERTHYFTDEPVRVTVQVHDQEGDPIREGEVSVTATGPDGSRKTVPLLPVKSSPGQFSGELHELGEGRHQIEASGAAIDQIKQPASAVGSSNNHPEGQSTVKSTEEPTEEPTSGATSANGERASTSILVRKRMQRELIDTRCDLALAQKLAQATRGQILPPTAINEVVALTDLTPHVSETKSERPLWPRWHWLLAVFGCLNLEWIVRKWRGLS